MPASTTAVASSASSSIGARSRSVDSTTVGGSAGATEAPTRPVLAPCGSRRTPVGDGQAYDVAHLVDVGGSEHERGAAALAACRLLEAGDVVDAGDEHVGDAAKRCARTSGSTPPF